MNDDLAAIVEECMPLGADTPTAPFYVRSIGKPARQDSTDDVMFKYTARFMYGLTLAWAGRESDHRAVHLPSTLACTFFGRSTITLHIEGIEYAPVSMEDRPIWASIVQAVIQQAANYAGIPGVIAVENIRWSQCDHKMMITVDFNGSADAVYLRSQRAKR